MNEDHMQEEENLSELPEDLLWERERHYPGGKTPTGAGTPPDIGYQNRANEDVAQSREGTLTQGANVQSSFDTRPVNGTDFYRSVTDSHSVGGEFLNPSIWSGSIQVPDGYVMVLRNLSIRLYNANAGEGGFAYYVGINNWRITIKVNKISQEIEQIPISLPLKHFPVHVIGASNEQFTFVLMADNNEHVSDTIVAEFRAYGNLLLARGVPKQYEIGEAKKETPVTYDTPNKPQQKPQQNKPQQKPQQNKQRFVRGPGGMKMLIKDSGGSGGARFTASRKGRK